MPTKEEEVKCGFCGGAFSKRHTRQSILYEKSCACCQNPHCILHDKCAVQFVNQRLRDEEQKTFISLDAFKANRIPFYCLQCRQRECFICEKKHQLIITSKAGNKIPSPKLICPVCNKKWSAASRTCQKLKPRGLKIICSDCKKTDKSSNTKQQTKKKKPKNNNATSRSKTKPDITPDKCSNKGKDEFNKLLDNKSDKNNEVCQDDDVLKKKDDSNGNSNDNDDDQNDEVDNNNDDKNNVKDDDNKNDDKDKDDKNNDKDKNDKNNDKDEDDKNNDNMDEDNDKDMENKDDDENDKDDKNDNDNEDDKDNMDEDDDNNKDNENDVENGGDNKNDEENKDEDDEDEDDNMNIDDPDNNDNANETNKRSKCIGRRPRPSRFHQRKENPLNPKDYSDITRSTNLKNLSDDDSPINYVSKCPENQISNICNLIAVNLKLKASRQKPKWNSLEGAFEDVVKRFGFDYGSDNLIFLRDPSNEAGLRKEYDDENLFSFNLRDAKSLVAKNRPPITSNVINFVMQCLNFYIFHTNDQDTVPSICFGRVDDVNGIVPDSNSYNNIHTHVNTPISSESSVDKQNCIRDMKHWFRSDDKGHLTRYLDNYHSKCQLIKNYTTVVPLNKQYFLVDVEFDIASSDPHDHKVTTSDFYNTHPTEVTQVRVWFAKYFGLYHMDFCDKDRDNNEHFDCHDVKQYLDKEGDTIKKNSSDSIFPNSAEEDIIQHRVNSDAGLYAIMLCIQKITGQPYMSDANFKDNKKRKDEFTDLRIRIVHLMDEIFDAFNMMLYVKHIEHFCFTEGDIHDYKHMNKWYMIHDLFRKNVYKYGRRCNAKSQFQALSFKKVQSTYNQRDPKKRVISLTKSQRESRKKAKHENFKKLSALKLFNLGAEVHTRSAAVHNISSKRTIVLYDISKYDNSDSIPTEFIYTPYDMYIKTHFILCWRYRNPHNRDYNNLKQVQDMFKYDMYQHNTFFAMDLVKDGVTNEDVYTIKACMIVELDLTFKDGSSCIVIHCAACKFGCDDVGYLETLLYGIFKNKPSLRYKPVVFVWRYGSMTYLKQHYRLSADQEPGFMTPKHLFLDMGFVEKSVPQMENDLHPKSLCLVGEVNQILKYCATFVTSGKTVRLCMFEASNRIKYRYSLRRPFGNTDSDDDVPNTENANTNETDTDDQDQDVDNTNKDNNDDKSVESVDSIPIPTSSDDESVGHHQKLPSKSNKDSANDTSSKASSDGLRDTSDEESNNDNTTGCNNNELIDPGFEIYTHAMLWMNMTEEDENYLTVEKKEEAKKNPGVKYYFSGGGARKETDNASKDFDLSVPIPKKFQQSSYDQTESNCVILTGAMLISLFDIDEADSLLDMFKKNQIKYEWIEPVKYPNSIAREHAQQYGKDTLQQILQKYTSYQLKKVQRNKTQQCFLYQILNEMTHGKYMVKLKLEDNTQQHVIGIDCDKQLIYDCMEEYALPLNNQNINNCGGKQYAKVYQIKDCWELIPHLTKKNKKTKK